MIIGISGKIGAGKDAVAARLVSRWGFRVVRFADALKEEVLARLPRTLRALHDLHPDHVNGCDSGDVAACLHEMVYVRKPSAVRELLQEYGTDVRRGDDPAYWVSRWRARVVKAEAVVTPDVRFPDEAMAIREAGGLLWRVERKGTAPGDHVSETLMDTWPSWDAVLRNDSTMADLHRLVDQLADGPRTQPQDGGHPAHNALPLAIQ